MKEKKLFRDYPVPVTEDYFKSLEIGITRRWKRQRVLRRAAVILPLAAGVLLALFLVIHGTPPVSVPPESPPANALQRVVDSRDAVPVDSPEWMPVDFDIARTNGNVKLVWSADPHSTYVVKKCSLQVGGFDCFSEDRVMGSSYEDPADPSHELIVYRVYSLRS